MSVIDDYLSHVDPAQRAGLERVRRIVMEAVPDGQDTISYGMPVIKQDGKYILGFAPFKDHLSIFPGSAPIEELADQLAPFKVSRGTVQFTLDQPIPEALLRDIVRICVRVARAE